MTVPQERGQRPDQLRACPHRAQASGARIGMGLEIGVLAEQDHARMGGSAERIGPFRLTGRPIDQDEIEAVRQVGRGVDANQRGFCSGRGRLLSAERQLRGDLSAQDLGSL